MIEQPTPLNSAWIIGDIKPPIGKGVNFQIYTTNVAQLHEECIKNQAIIFLPLEEKWYQGREFAVYCVGSRWIYAAVFTSFG